MTPEQRKEEVSKAYVHAVAARCGFAIGEWSQDHGCVDVTIGAAHPVGSGVLAGPKVDVQLKATSRDDVLREDRIAWQLERGHYDHLRAERTVPIVFVVLLLPEDEDEWIEHSVEQLILRRCAYWVSLYGAPPADGETKVVSVPLSNVFGPKGLEAILEMVSKGETP
ncbi:MAG: DUF4365 domain-containing protein [Myxococcota bacterium]